MSRTISADGLKSLFAEDSDMLWAAACTISHAQLTSPVRIVQNLTAVSYGGNSYTAIPFELVLAADNEETVPQARIRIDNIGQDLIAGLRGITTPATIAIEIFRINSAGTVTREMGPISMSMLSITVTNTVIEGILGYEQDLLNESATSHRFTPESAPGLFL